MFTRAKFGPRALSWTHVRQRVLKTTNRLWRLNMKPHPVWRTQTDGGGYSVTSDHTHVLNPICDTKPSADNKEKVISPRTNVEAADWSWQQLNVKLLGRNVSDRTDGRVWTYCIYCNKKGGTTLPWQGVPLLDVVQGLGRSLWKKNKKTIKTKG